MMGSKQRLISTRNPAKEAASHPRTERPIACLSWCKPHCVYGFDWISLATRHLCPCFGMNYRGQGHAGGIGGYQYWYLLTTVRATSFIANVPYLTGDHHQKQRMMAAVLPLTRR